MAIELILLQKEEQCTQVWTFLLKLEHQSTQLVTVRISRADNRAVGFGNHVRIDHGFGYVSIYAHMSKIEVRRGNKVKRGDLIGYVGNTGRSVAPHLHYEIVKDGRKINPINFYTGSLTPLEFEKLVNQASQENQSLD